jgi:hypothetical protein
MAATDTKATLYACYEPHRAKDICNQAHSPGGASSRHGTDRAQDTE